ncbi:dipeptidyl peptidase 4 isoform X2 [Folsomia candida]|uniref:dipeptidyl peptidase 4 isoform X2 n=1 Tax=Folsomia candida TaxID=158441 RepID=UPI000B8FAE3C|nr:dipeptidyl peptidase 4 isoform X2 [Folsomia candida]
MTQKFIFFAHFLANFVLLLNAQDPVKEPITLNDFLTGTLSAGGFGGSWVPGSDDTLRVISGNNIWEYDLDTKQNRSVVTSSQFTERFGTQSLGLSVSKDNAFILIEHSRRQLWRHSYLAKYDVLELATNQFSVIQPTGFENDPQIELQLVVWDASGHGVAFVYGNNVYYKAAHGAGQAAVQITQDGGDAIFNGISDWVYEEEMYGSPVAMWFSTDSSSLAFVRFDDSGVDFFQWPLYGEPGVRETVYPVYEPLRYPKAGRDNPLVSLHIVKLDNPTTVRQITYPAGQDPQLQYYIATITWATANRVIIQNFNRHQNRTVWNFCNADDGTCAEVADKSADNPVGWWDPHRPTVSRDGSKFLTFVNAHQDTDPFQRSYRHIASLNSVGPNPEVPTLTDGAFHVDSILGWDEANDRLYFSGTGLPSPLGNPSERHAYYVALSGPNLTPQCFTCALRNGFDEECHSHSVSLSANFKFYMHTCRGPGVPEVTTRFTSNHTVAHTWNNNAAVRARLETKLLPSVTEMEVDVAGGFKAKVRLLLPPNFDAAKKYPMMVDVYGGPDSQAITQDYGINWGYYLASSRGVIYAKIDGRGSARQSAEQKFAVYRNLGSAEVEDQISVARHLITLGYIDPEKTAIWGWSYGGYATAMALGKDSGNVFKCGISVAPVSSWLYYDTIYTERYMGLPSAEDNWAGYNQSSVMAHLTGIANKEFLLIHGNADDNVHYQNSMMLARALEQADILFESLSYPEENHNINGPGMRLHLYHSIEHFLTRDTCFGELGNPGEEGTTTSTPPVTGTGSTDASSNHGLTYLILVPLIGFVKEW